MKPHFAKIYLGEIIMQADMTVLIVHNINVAVTQGHTVQAFGLLHYLLIHAGIVSRMLWPPSGKARRVRRARELREMLGVDDTHTLADRRLRNHLEHYDERLDSWVEESPRHGFVDRLIGPRAGIQGVDDRDVFRLFDPVANLFIFRGESFAIQSLVDGLDDIRERAVKAHCRAQYTIGSQIRGREPLSDTP
jgi:hypothetical protein